MVITVQCPECSASFPVDPAKIPLGGVRVRCSVCAAVFWVDELEEAAPSRPVAPPRPRAGIEPTGEGPGSAQRRDVWEHFASDTDFSAGVETPGSAPAPESADDWVFETEEAVDPASLDIEPVGTVEDAVEQARDESSFFAGDETFETNDRGGGAAVEEATTPPTGFTLGRRDPHDKARRLARVLVSDIVTYNPERHQRALEGGTLKQDFEDEIEKSWKEYVEQVGEEIAGSTTYWTEALNDVLAQGRQVF